MNFVFTYHPLWIAAIVLIAASLTLILYYRDKLLEDLQRWVKVIMACLRFTLLFLILFLLLGLIFENTEERKEEPLIFLAHDNSESVVMNKDSVFYETTYLTELENTVQKIGESYEVITYNFAETVNSGLKADYSGKQTDLSLVVEQIFEQYGNRNIGAIILSTDGIYNTGANPVYTVSEKGYIPIYTIGLGDTNIVRDIKIDLVNHNDVAFLGNEFPVEVNFSASRCTGEQVTVSIEQKGKVLASEKFQVKADFESFKSLLMLRAEGTGLQQYTARISAVQGEFTTRNNSFNFYVDVIDGRQKILIAHQSPHPDVAAVRFVIENNKNYEAEVKYLKDVSSVEEYDLVVVHNYESTSSVIDQAVNRGSVPFLFINGLGTNMRAAQQLKIGFTGTANSSEEIGFSHNSAFQDVLLDAKTIQTFATAPPLHAPFGNLSYSSALDILAFQKVGNIQLDNPLIYFTTKESARIGVIMGEGIWRWRLHDQNRNNSTVQFETFMSKLITYLAVKENKEPFRVNVESEYAEGEEVKLEAELYNQSYELINESTVNFIFQDESGKEFKSEFLPVGNRYQLNLGRLKGGMYSWTASTKFQDKQYVKSGNFLVKELKLEWLNTTANHRLLRNLSENTGGRFYFPNEISQLENDLKSDKNLVSVVYQEKTFDDLIDYKWLFFLLIIFAGLEWFLRKYNGAY